MVGFTSRQYSQRIQELEKVRTEQLQEYRSSVSVLSTQVSKLSSENKKMKEHVKIIERKGADGSTERIFDSSKSAESEKLIEEHTTIIQKMTYDYQMLQMSSEHEKQRIKEESPTLSISIGLDNDFKKFMHLHYMVYSPVVLGLWGNDRGMYGISAGVSF